MEDNNTEFNKKMFFEHLILTFIIMIILWVPLIILG